MNWQLYILECSDDSLYTGITNDLARRMSQHATGKGAKYFRGRDPMQVVYLESGLDRSSASVREAAVKRLDRAEKLRLIASDHNEIKAQPLPLSELCVASA